MLSESHLNFNECTTLWEILELAVDWQKRKPAFFILVAETLWECWKDRCNAVFERQTSRKPALMVIRNTVLIVEALLYRTTNKKKAAEMQMDNQVLLRLISEHIGSSAIIPATT
jgi:hypothetical protein